MPIPGNVANLPVLGAWLTMKDQNQNVIPGQQLAQASQFMTLQGEMQQQEARRVAAQRDAAFRQKMAAATTDEERAQIAMEAEGAKGVLQHLDRKSRDQATQAANAALIAQRAAQFDQNMQLRWSNAKDNREKALIEAQWKQGRLEIETANAQIAGRNLQYNTGHTVDIPQTPQLTMPGSPSQGTPPAQAPVTYSFNTPNGYVSGQSENVNGALGVVGRQESPISPAAVVAGVQPAGVAPAPVPQPAAPNNFDARDLKVQQTAPIVTPQIGQGVPVARAAAQAYADMPNFTGSPKEVARAKNEWLSDRAKAEAKAASKDGKIGISLTGSRESTFINRVVNSGSQAAADLANVVALPMSASRGIFGGRGQGKGLLDAAQESLTNKMTTQEVQSYNVVATGFQRALAAIEGMGLAPTNALMHQMEGIIFKEGDTNMTKLLKLAQTRQIVDKGLEVIVTNPRVDEETKKLVKKTLDNLNSSVPFTPSDVLKLEGLQATNPKATLRDVMAQKKAETQGSWDAAKEKRLQELKAQLGK